MKENEIGAVVVDSAIAVHRELGPGLLETVYELVLADELQHRGIAVERQVPVDIACRGRTVIGAFRVDILAGGKVILELKSVEKTKAVHKKQLQTYLKLMRCRLGYLLNFGEELMKNGIARCVNGLVD